MDSIKKAISTIKDGGIVLFPTDTIYGMGCRIDSLESVKKLFRIKKRPKIEAVPVLVNSIEMAEEYLVSPLDNNVRQLMKKHWPGAVTFVSPCKIDKVYSLIRGGGPTLGVRMPDHKIPLRLIDAVKMPVIGTSANFHKKEPPKSYTQIDKRLKSLVDEVVKGKCYLKKPSTVVNCTKHLPEVIREGAVEIDKI